MVLVTHNFMAPASMELVSPSAPFRQALVKRTKVKGGERSPLAHHEKGKL